MGCKRCGGKTLPPATICDACAAPPAAAGAPAVSGKTSPAASSAPGLVATAIPSRNVPALVSYYTGLFSVVPYLGIVLAPTALISGIWGLVLASKRPEVRGKAHAWTGIVAALVLGTVGHLLKDKADLLLEQWFGKR